MLGASRYCWEEPKSWVFAAAAATCLLLMTLSQGPALAHYARRRCLRHCLRRCKVSLNQAFGRALERRFRCCRHRRCSLSFIPACGRALVCFSHSLRHRCDVLLRRATPGAASEAKQLHKPAAGHLPQSALPSRLLPAHPNTNRQHPARFHAPRSRGYLGSRRHSEAPPRPWWRLHDPRS